MRGVPKKQKRDVSSPYGTANEWGVKEKGKSGEKLQADPYETPRLRGGSDAKALKKEEVAP